MTILELGHPPVQPHRKLTAGPFEPVARQVVLWVGVSDPVMAGMRDRLPSCTRSMLGCCDQGFAHTIRLADGIPVTVRRIRYGRRPLGYGVVVANWMTIAPRVSILDHMRPGIVSAQRVLQQLSLVARVHLTDRTPA